MITVKSARELAAMREAGRLVGMVLAELQKAIRPGITTKELDTLAENLILQAGGKPAFKGYHGFPATICTSVNEEVVHGIPGLKTLKNGDIISIDVGAAINGFYGDAAATFPVGEIGPQAQKLLTVTKTALERGIKQALPGKRLTDISHEIQTYVEANGFSVVRDYTGHGIGRNMHEDPPIPNYGPPNRGPRLEEGMTLAIEPMVTIGSYRVKTLPDHWTVVTCDGSLAAHFEHTIAITADGPEVLTRW